MLSLAHLPLPLPELHQAAAQRGFVTVAGLDEGQALHAFLTETFGDRALQPFRLLAAPGSRTAGLYAYTRETEEALRATAVAVATPELAALLRSAALRLKPMPVFRAGQRLGFDVRLRPVVRLALPLPASPKPGQRVLPKGAEADAFLAHVMREAPEGAPADQTGRREGVYLDWLAARLRGATLDTAASRMVRFQRSLAVRGGKRIEGPDAVIHGTLTITDSDAFADQLGRGVGRHRTWGYGMLLLRPPQSRARTC